MPMQHTSVSNAVSVAIRVTHIGVVAEAALLEPIAHLALVLVARTDARPKVTTGVVRAINKRFVHQDLPNSIVRQAIGV